MPKYEVLNLVEHKRPGTAGVMYAPIYVRNKTPKGEFIQVKADWPETVRSVSTGKMIKLDATGLIELNAKQAEPLLAIGSIRPFIPLGAAAAATAAKKKAAPKRKKAA